MKLNNKHIAILIFIIFYACNGPNVTELTVEQDRADTSTEILELENIAPVADGGLFSNNYDSTGVVNPAPKKYFNVISFSKIESKNNLRTVVIDYATAQFFDKSQPIKNNNGKVIGYKSVLMGDLFFNDTPAKTTKSVMHMMMHGARIKITNGMRYLLVKKNSNSGESIAPYGGVISVTLKKMRMMKFNAQVPVPESINAVVFKKGDFRNNNLEIRIGWKNPTGKKLEVIIGGIKQGNTSVIPLIKFKTPDDGTLNLPANLVNSIPLQNFKYLVLTLIRRMEREVNSQKFNSKFYVSSQSIQNLRFEIK